MLPCLGEDEPEYRSEHVSEDEQNARHTHDEEHIADANRTRDARMISAEVLEALCTDDASRTRITGAVALAGAPCVQNAKRHNGDGDQTSDDVAGHRVCGVESMRKE